MKRTILSVLFACLTWAAAWGQVTIEECYRKARENYPLVRQYGLIAESEEFNLGNASKGYLPQFGISGKATYQTEVIELPISLPGIDIPKLNRDQYQIVAEVSQAVWDGGAARSRKEAVRAQAEADRAQYEVDMYALNGRVDELFFSILLIDEQLRLNELFSSELEVNYGKVAALAANGLANPSDLDAVEVEQVAARQRRTELESMKKAYVQMLAAIIGEPAEGLTLLKPSPGSYSPGAENRRPELGLFDARTNQMLAQRKSVNARNMPQIGLFVQGGYGNPGLNMLKEGWAPFAVGGVRLSWNFGGLYTRGNELKEIDNGIRSIDIQRETFLFNNSLRTQQQAALLEKYRPVLADDDRIIELRRNIRRASEAKVENGTMDAAELMRDVNAEQNARLTKAMHEIEMLQAIYGLKNLTNN